MMSFRDPGVFRTIALLSSEVSSSPAQVRVATAHLRVGRGKKESECENAVCLQVRDDLYLNWIQPPLTAIGPNLVTWPQLAAREAEKYSLAGKLSAQEGRTHLQNSLPHR